MKRGRGPFEETTSPFVFAETKEYLVLYKPAGMHSVPGKGEGNLLSWYAAERPEEAAGFAEGSLGLRSKEFGMTSRLDAGTSGLVLFARSPGAFERLRSLSASGLFSKRYRALVAASEAPLPGSLPPIKPLALGVPQEGEVPPAAEDGWLVVESRFRSYGPRGARVACVQADRSTANGKRTTGRVYRSRLRLEGSDATQRPETLVCEVEIEGGFRHQIRAHLAWSGFPILGDTIYGGRPAPRLYLEAHRIELGGDRPEVFELYGDYR